MCRGCWLCSDSHFPFSLRNRTLIFLLVTMYLGETPAFLVILLAKIALPPAIHRGLPVNALSHLVPPKAEAFLPLSCFPSLWNVKVRLGAEQPYCNHEQPCFQTAKLEEGGEETMWGSFTQVELTSYSSGKWALYCVEQKYSSEKNLYVSKCSTNSPSWLGFHGRRRSFSLTLGKLIQSVTILPLPFL